MSKFDEMCSAYVSARNKGIAYRDRSFENLGRLVQGLVSYCEIPESHFCYLPLKETPVEGRQYGLAGAIHFDDDGYWHLGLQLLLRDNESQFSQSRILVVLCLCEQDEKVMVKIGANGKERELDMNDESQCVVFYNDVVEIVKRWFSQLRESMEKSGTLRTIGFKVTP